jgi:hypothetical protein
MREKYRENKDGEFKEQVKISVQRYFNQGKANQGGPNYAF